MEKLRIIRRILNPELAPRYIVSNEQGKLKLINSDADLLKISDQFIDYKILEGYESELEKEFYNQGSLLFVPVNTRLSIDYITVIIPDEYWYAQVKSGIKKLDILMHFIRSNITDDI